MATIREEQHELTEAVRLEVLAKITKSIMNLQDGDDLFILYSHSNELDDTMHAEALLHAGVNFTVNSIMGFIHAHPPVKRKLLTLLMMEALSSGPGKAEGAQA